MAKKDKDFELINLPEEARDPEIKAEDFTLTHVDTTIHEQKFQTKPTTFLKDSLKRFKKNKSSVVATYILGILILLAIVVPIVDPNDVSKPQDIALKNLEPKLFNAGTGFWDGIKTVRHEPVQRVDYVEDEVNKVKYLPDPSIYWETGISDMTPEGEQYTNVINSFGRDGYVHFGLYGGMGSEAAYLRANGSSAFTDKNVFTLDVSDSSYTVYVNKFTVIDEAKLKENEGEDKSLPQGFKLGEISLEFVYRDGEEEKYVTLVDPAITQDINETNKIDISKKIRVGTGKSTFTDFTFRIKVAKTEEQSASDHICSLIQNIGFSTDSSDSKVINFFSSGVNADKTFGLGFDDAMQFLTRDDSVGQGAEQKKNYGYWSSGSNLKFVRNVYLGKSYFATFKYNPYLAKLGDRDYNVSGTDMKTWRQTGVVLYGDYFTTSGGVTYFDKAKWDNWANAHGGHGIVILDSTTCPIAQEVQFEDLVYDGIHEATGERMWHIKTKVTYYKVLGMKEMPIYLLGTDNSGRDMFKYVFEGLRNSLLIGVLTFIVCFLFGLLWGSISGYFGGAVDLIMERFTDILSGIPWIVLMTIIILKAKENSFGIFVLALCLTGWIGTASTTRTQFYRFRGREYVLASRTLGASDGRLIFKHILPNAMGTIITGAVLMIPSVIFSEATISYLGLGFQDMSSLGVILSANQDRLFDYPYQLIFPSIVIALVMISFNLFGNGLRDAINPSLKGED